MYQDKQFKEDLSEVGPHDNKHIMNVFCTKNVSKSQSICSSLQLDNNYSDVFGTNAAIKIEHKDGPLGATNYHKIIACEETNEANTQKIHIKQETLDDDQQEDLQKNDDLTKPNIIHNVKTEKQENTLDVKITSIKSEDIMFNIEDETYQCRHCDYRTVSRKSILTHVQLLLNYNELPSNSFLSRDMAGADANGSSESPLPHLYCNDCDYSCTSKSHLITHLLTHASKEVLQYQLCHDTRQKSSFKKHTIIHSKKQHRCASVKYLKESALVKAKGTESIKTLLACDHCDYRCKRKATLIIHLRKHGADESLICAKYDLTCSNKKSLVDRKIIYRKKKPYSCNYCDYKCIGKVSLNTHMQKQHHGEKPFTCKYCGYKSSCKSHLTRHIRQHSGEKPYACNYCEYKCNQKSYLTIHIRKHTGEKPYACNYCDYKSSYKTHLNRHIRQHTGEKRYFCNYCEYKCVQKSYLPIHMRQHTSEKPRLITRNRVHTGEKFYACNYCDYKGTHQGYLDRHSRTHLIEKK